jgi:hypothetical protein
MNNESIRALDSANDKQVKKIQLHRLNRRYKEDGGALVLPLFREHVKQQATKSTAPVEPTV